MDRAGGPSIPLRESLETAALAGGRWGDVIGLLAAAVGTRVRLVAADGALLCEADAGGVREFDGAEDFGATRERVVSDADVRRAFAAIEPVEIRCLDTMAVKALAVSAGERRVGIVMIGTDGPAKGDRLRDAATAVAIVAVRRDAEASAVAETASWFVDELRFGTSRDPAELCAVGRRFGVDLGVDQVGVEVHYDGSDSQMFAIALTWLETPVRQNGRRAWTLCPADAPGRFDLIARRLASMVRDGVVRVAVGTSAADPPSIRMSFARARFAAAYAQLNGRTGVIAFAELRSVGLLSELPHADLEAYARLRLGALLSKPELLETLREWFRSGGSWRAVAEATNVHRNSVGHRLERIRSLLGVDVADPATSFDLQLALTALDVLRVARSDEGGV